MYKHTQIKKKTLNWTLLTFILWETYIDTFFYRLFCVTQILSITSLGLQGCEQMM